MRTKGNQNHEAEEFDDEDFGSGKEGPSSNATSNNSGKINKDGKDSDKANAMRSKHSVTEQRRRSKINERFQILRDLIPHSDQKRDTASFLLEVIEYVQYLQEKVQKFEGSFQGWNSEPAKLVPWRNSHWRVQNFSSHPQALKNGSGQPGSTVPGKYDEHSIMNQVIPINHPDSDPSKAVEQQTLSMPLNTSVRSDTIVANPLHQTVSSTPLDFPITADTLDQSEDLIVEGGTISISSIYSQGLLNNLTQALQNAGVDLSGANISVQIELGKKGNKEPTSRTSAAKDLQSCPQRNQAAMHIRDSSIGDDINSARKRQKT